MALSLVQYGDQDNGVVTSSGSAASVFSSNTTPGNAVVLMIYVASGSENDVTTVSSSIGTFNLISRSGINSPAIDLECWVCLNATGAALTVTVTTADSTGYVVCGWEVSGGVALAVSGASTAGSGTSASLVMTGLTSGQFVAAAVKTANTITGSPSGSWVGPSYGYWNTATLGNAEQVVTGSSATATWTQSAGQWWACSAVLYPSLPSWYVQRGDSGSSVLLNSGSPATVLPNNTTPGNTVVLAIGSLDAVTNSVTSVSSGIGTFRRVSTILNSYNGLDLEWWVCQNVTGAAKTITASLITGADQYAAAAWEISGTYGSAVSGGSSNATAAGATLTVNSLTTGSLVFVLEDAAQGSTLGPGLPWINVAGASNGQAVGWNEFWDIAVTAASSSSATATWSFGTGTAQYWTVGLVLPVIAVPTITSETAQSYGGVELVSASINPNYGTTTVSVNYGPTSGYGSNVGTLSVSGGSPVTVYLGIPVSPGGYHYQFTATNSAGTTNGTDATFTAVGLPSYTGG